MVHVRSHTRRIKKRFSNSDILIPKFIGRWHLIKTNQKDTYIWKLRGHYERTCPSTKMNPGGGDMSDKWHTVIFQSCIGSMHEFHNSKQEALEYLFEWMKSHPNG